MRIKITEKQKSVAVCTIWVFAVCLLLSIAVWRFSALVAIAKKVIAVLAPVIWGLVIAYLMSPLQNWIEKKLGKLTDRKKEHPVLRRSIAVTITILLLLTVLVGLIAMLLPEIVESLKGLMGNLPEYRTNAGTWIADHIAGLKETQPQLHAAVISMLGSLQNGLTNLISEFEPKVDSLVSGANLIGSITSGAYSIFNAVKNFVLGIMVAIYLLYNKERYLAQIKKLMYALFPEKKVHTALHVGSRISYTFMHFLSGKSLDSLIIGLLCFLGMTLMDMPYTVLISLIVGVTNIIPFFGPFIGAIPSAFLILLSQPSKVIPFVIFILVLQQFDGNFLGPKILGDSLGLPTFWVLFAIFAGGGLFGFVGMVAFVPLFAALYTFTKEFLAQRLSRKGLPCDTDSYMTGDPVFAEKLLTAPESDPVVAGEEMPHGKEQEDQ